MSSSHLWRIFNIRFFLPIYFFRICSCFFTFLKLPGQSFFTVLYEFLDFCNARLHKPTFYITRYTEFPVALSSMAPNIHEILIDIGCGKSPFSLFLSFYDKKITASDISFTDLNDLKTSSGNYYPKAKLPFFTCADSQSLPFKTASFDKLFCISVLEHLPGESDKNTISEALRILKPGGKAFFSFEMDETFCEEKIENSGDRSDYCKRYSKKNITELFFNRPDFAIAEEGIFTRFLGIRKFYKMNRPVWNHLLLDWIQPFFAPLFMMSRQRILETNRIPYESWGYVILQKKGKHPKVLPF